MKNQISKLFKVVMVILFSILLLVTTNKSYSQWIQDTSHFPMSINSMTKTNLGRWVTSSDSNKIYFQSKNDTIWCVKKNDIPTNYSINLIYFISDSVGFVGSSNYHQILRTTNCGQNWNKGWYGDIFGKITSITFNENNIGYITGNRNDENSSNVFYTSDGGANWTWQTNLISTIDINSATIMNDTFYCATANKIYKIKHVSGINFYISSITFTNQTLVSVTFHNRYLWYWITPQGIHQSVNGGNSSLPIYSCVGLNKIYSVDSANIFACGNNKILRSGNAGYNWIDQTHPVGNYTGFYFSKLSEGYCFNNTMVLKLTDITTINNNSSLISKEYTLNQNYPNPFNASTKISYNGTSKARFNVYNIIGKLVYSEMITNGYIFDAKELTSGIYFYNIQNGNYKSETKKMTLLK